MVTQTGSYDLFDALYPDYKCKKPVRLIEFFGGIGSQAKALERLGVEFEPWKLVEIDKFAVESYNAIHGTGFSTSDITQLHGEDLSVVAPDLYDYILTWSFPCGRAGTLINTRRGLVKIEDVKVGDYVLTHDGSWQMVTWSGKTGEKELYSIKAMCVPSDTQYTYNHPFYVRKKLLSVDSGKVKVSFSEPEFKSCGEIAADDASDWYCGFKINTESRIPVWGGIELKMGPTRYEHRDTINSFIANPDFWWIVGRYVADGWHRQQGGIIIACGWPIGRKDLRGVKTEALLERFDRLGVHATVANEKTCDKVHVTYREWEAFLDPIGRGAMNKEIPQFILDLPEFLLKAFVDGYLAGDGQFNEKTGYWRAASVSRSLAMGLSQAIMKAYHVGVSVQCKLYEEGHTCIIEGREVTQHSVWMLSFKPDSITGKSFYENDYIWFPFYGIEPTGNIESVYDLTVENSHSFIGDNIVVHNCTSLSVSGLRQGMAEGTGTASSLIWEVKRILQEMNDLETKYPDKYGLPKILLMENVPQVIDAKNVQDLNKMRDFLESLGYSNHLAIMKGNDYGVPQARHRAFMVSILGDETNPVYSYQFPTACGCKWSMQDCLTDEFDAKHYIQDSVAHQVCEDNALFNRNTAQKLNTIKLCGRLNAHQAGGVFDPCGVSPTLTAGGASAVNILWRESTTKPDTRDWKDPKWFTGDSDVDIDYIEDPDAAIEFFFNTDEEKKEYKKESDYHWSPVCRAGTEYKLRTLTPQETLQIMDFDVKDYEKAKLVTSPHQMHKQAGNSIVVNCIVALLGQFFEGKEDIYKDIAEIPPKNRYLVSTKKS